MKIQKITLFLLFTFLLVRVDHVHANEPIKCMTCFLRLLKEGGFSGPTDENEADIQIEEVGSIKISGETIKVFDFRYETKPLVGMVSHGGQRIVILIGSKYTGQYVLSPPPAHELRLNSSTILLPDIPEKFGNKIALDENGPPEQAWIDQEVIKFAK